MHIILHREHREQYEQLEQYEHFEQMNNEFRYILEPYKGLNSVLPLLQRKNQFTRYFDQETNEPLNNSVGLCNRAINAATIIHQNNTLKI
jgi:hypothetical protein